MKVLENFQSELINADPKIKKRAIKALIGSVIIHPKKGNSRERS